MNLPEYKFRSDDLLQVLVSVGFSKNKTIAYQKLFRLKWDNKFTPPKDPTSKDWVFTEEQLIDIAKSLSPGGSGEWHFEEL